MQWSKPTCDGCAMTSPSRVVITGIDGFTGQHLTRRLRSAGWEVYGMTGPGGPILPDTISADLRDQERMVEWLSEIKPSHIVHLAALSHVVGPPLPFYEVNVLGTESLLQAIEQAGISLTRLVIASSANIYGQAYADPITEAHLPRPANHYALSKLAMEGVAQQWFDRLPIIITRPFNYTGPGQSEAFLFPKLVAAFHRRDPVLTLGNLAIARDLSAIEFVTQCYHRLLTIDRSGEVFNICSGRSVSIEQSLEILRELTGYGPRIESDPALVRANDIAVLTGDPTRLQDAVGPLEPIAPRAIFSTMLDALEGAPPA